MPKFKRIIILMLLGLYILPQHSAFAENGLEHSIKASLILKFSSFITWPAEGDPAPDSRHLVFCISGKDNFGDIFDLAKEENIINVNLTVKRLGNSNDFKSCNILYLSSLEKPRIQFILNQVKDLSILVIGESPGLADLGVGINFLIANNKIRFEINRHAIHRSGLGISSQLLALADRVLEGP
ncbi:MAG: YfiR family protein [Nitrospinota bacterium]|nr:YfiR family protein [Nitrospinota bacterium]